MEEDTTYRKLYVENLSFSTRGTGLRNYFLQFGAVTEAFVVYDIHGGSRGIGFVTFRNPQDAAIACWIQFHIIDGRMVNCNLAAFPVQKTSQPSSPYRGPIVHFGPPAPHPFSFPFVGYPLLYTNPYGYGSPNSPMSVYVVPQPSGSNQPAAFNYPMYGPRPMYGVPPVYPYGQPSGSNEPVTSNNPMHGPGSVPPVYPSGQASGSNEPVTSNNPMHGPGSVPPVYPSGQASGSNEPANGSPMSDASLSANPSVEEASS